jgi:WD40 repeat protein
MTGEMEAQLKGHTDSVNYVTFSQDGTRVVSGSEDKTARIWNATTGKMEAKLEGHTRGVSLVAFSQDGSQVVSGSDDKTVRIWNVTTGEMEAELKGHTDWIDSIAFSQDGSRVVTGLPDKTIRIWNAITGEMEAKLEGHMAMVKPVVLSLDTSGVIPRSFDEVTACIRKALTSKLESQLLFSISRDGDWILGTHSDCWIPGHYRTFHRISLSGSRACFGYIDGRVIILDMRQ